MAEPHEKFSAELILEIGRRARLTLAKRCAERKDILAWGKLLFAEKFTLPFCHELHDYFVEIRGEPFTSTEAPRGHAKTTIKCNLIPLFQALEEPATFRHYLNVQANQEKALAVNRSIKVELETNELLRDMYGEMIGERWTDAQFVLKNGVVFTAIGAGQSIRGLNYRNRRPDYIIIDDLYDEEDRRNLEATEKKNEWFWGSLYPARSQSSRSAVHIQGTAMNAVDLMEKLKKAKGVKTRTFRGIKDHTTKEVLWKELKTYDDYMAELERGMPLVVFNREIQNERGDDSESKVKRAWLENWEYDPGTLRFDADFSLVTVRLGCDPSIGEGLESDFTGMAVVLKCKFRDAVLPDFYIHSLVNERLTMNERIEKIKKLQVSMPAKLKIRQARIEGISGFADFGAEVRRRGTIPVEIIKKTPDKLTHLENKSGLFQNGKVHLNRNIDPNLKEMLVTQLTTNYPQHDDLRDAVLLALDTGNATWAHVDRNDKAAA